MKKALALTSFSAGYVLGARAGRERYEQIRKVALRIKDDPRVQDKAHEAAEAVRAETATLRDKVSDKLHGDHASTGPDLNGADTGVKVGGDPLQAAARP
jgi:hypothetical protein